MPRTEYKNMGMTYTDKEVDRQLERVQQAQSEFWSALGELEAMTGLELDSTIDYSTYTVDDLEDAEEE